MIYQNKSLIFKIISFLNKNFCYNNCIQLIFFRPKDILLSSYIKDNLSKGQSSHLKKYPCLHSTLFIANPVKVGGKKYLI